MLHTMHSVIAQQEQEGTVINIQLLRDGSSGTPRPTKREKVNCNSQSLCFLGNYHEEMHLDAGYMYSKEFLLLPKATASSR